MIDYQKAKDVLEYIHQEHIKQFGTEEWILPFEPRFLPNITSSKKDFLKSTKKKNKTFFKR